MVALLQFEAGVLQIRTHSIAHIDVGVVRRHREIAALRPHLVPAVDRAVRIVFGTCVPVGGGRVHLVEGAVHLGVVAHGIEDVELRLRPEVRGIGEAGALQKLLGLARDIARIAAVGLERMWIVDEAVQIQRLRGPEGVQLRGAQVREQQHIRFVNRLESAHRRAVEGDPVIDQIRAECGGRYRKVLLHTRYVTESNIDVFDFFGADIFQNSVGGGSQCCSLVQHGLLLAFAAQVYPRMARRPSLTPRTRPWGPRQVLLAESHDTTSTSMTDPNPDEIGTVGAARCRAEVQLSDDGEELIRGRMVTRGQHNDPDKTSVPRPRTHRPRPALAGRHHDPVRGPTRPPRGIRRLGPWAAVDRKPGCAAVPPHRARPNLPAGRAARRSSITEFLDRVVVTQTAAGRPG